MKLLLDTPEGKALFQYSTMENSDGIELMMILALYSHLARHSYLQAAFLWLIARVVKESLSSMPEEVNGVGLRSFKTAVQG